MQITSFNIDNNKLILSIEDASNASLLRLWTDVTYKDFTKAIDLTAKLNGAVNQTIEITLLDIRANSIEGIYFVEVEDGTSISTAYTYNLSKYKECILDRIVKNIKCNDCVDYFDQDTINSHSVLIATEYALELGYVESALNNIKVLNKYCNNGCESCDSFSNVVDLGLYLLNDDPQIVDLGTA